MKKYLKKAAALLCLLLLVLGLSACSMGLSEMLIVKRAYRQIADMDSLSFTLDAEPEAKLLSVPLKASVHGDCRCIISPGTLYMDLEIDMGKLGAMELPVYLFARDGSLRLMLGLGESGNTLWFSSVLPLSSGGGTGGGLDVETVLTLLQDDPEALSIGDSETVNGLLCRPFILKIPGSLLMEALGADDSDGSAAVKDLELSIWIAEEEGSPVRLSADLGPLLNYVLEKSQAPLLSRLEMESLPLTVDITGYNDVGSIELPQAE